MKQFATIFLLCCLILSHTSALEWPKFDLGMMLNPSILGKETIRAPAVAGKLQTQTFTYNSVSSRAITFIVKLIIIPTKFSIEFSLFKHYSLT